MSTNLILIDSNLKDTDVLLSALNAQTTGILYNYDTSRNTILQQIDAAFSVKTIQRVAICCHEGVNQFLENGNFFNLDGSTNEVLKNLNTYFILDLLTSYNVSNIDFLACNSLKYDSWKKFYDFIESEVKGVTVGASEDETGNIKYGGDWVLENTGENIKNTYFDGSIDFYKYLLALTVLDPPAENRYASNFHSTIYAVEFSLLSNTVNSWAALLRDQDPNNGLDGYYNGGLNGGVDNIPYIQINFDTNYVTGIASRVQPSGTQYIRSYRVRALVDGIWTLVEPATSSNAGNYKFIGNTASTDILVIGKFVSGITTTSVRIYPVENSNWTSGRFGIEIDTPPSITLSMSNIINDEFVPINIEFSKTIITESILNGYISFKPSYIADVSGNITSSDGGLTWTGYIKRNLNMNKLNNTLTLQLTGSIYGNISKSITFDVAENASYIRDKDWVLNGNSIDGLNSGDNNGNSVYTSGDGKRVAFATSNYNNSQGLVRIYEYDNSVDGLWKQIGSNLLGESELNQFGLSISMSYDGNLIAIGAPFNGTGGSVYVYEYDTGSSDWILKGTKIINTVDYEQNGYTVSLVQNNTHGIVVAIGSKNFEPQEGSSYRFRGRARMFKYGTTDWVQLGNAVDSGKNWDFSGLVTLSNFNSNDLILAHAAPDYSDYYDGIVHNKRGRVMLYTLTGTSGDWVYVTTFASNRSGDFFGYSCSFSSNGNILAIGTNQFDNHIISGSLWPNTTIGLNGYVNIYSLSSSNWTLIDTIEGITNGERSGYSIDLSDDGTLLAIGSPFLNNGFVKVYEYNSSTWIQKNSTILGSVSDSNFGFSVSISSDGTSVIVGAPNTTNGTVSTYNFDNSLIRQVLAIEFPDEITDTNATDFEVKFTTNDKAFTDINGFMSVSPDNGTLVVSNLSNNGFSMVGTFTANNSVNETNNTLSYNEPNVLGDKTFSINTITLNDITFSNIISDESSTLTIEFSGPIPTDTNLNTSVTIDPPYIAYLFGDITTSDGGTTWTGIIKRTPYMNRLSNTISVSYNGVTVNKTFDVLESAENSQLINKKWSLTNSNTINNVFTSTLQMSPNGLLMGFIDGSNVEIYRKSDTSYNWNHDVSYNGHSFSLTNNHIVLANNDLLQIYDYGGTSWSLMNGGNLYYSNVVELSINLDGTYVAISNNNDVKILKNVSDNWTHINTYNNSSVKSLSLSPNGLKLGMGIGTTGQDLSSVLIEDVVNNYPPVITVIGNTTINHEVNTSYIDEGATAFDSIDGDISNNIITNNAVNTSSLGTYTITYDISNSANISAIQKRRIVNVVDTTNPVVSLNGDASMDVELGTSYTEYGATVTDNSLEPLNVVIGGDTVDVNTEATYVVTYTATDSTGNSHQVSRSINVTSLYTLTWTNAEADYIESPNILGVRSKINATSTWQPFTSTGITGLNGSYVIQTSNNSGVGSREWLNGFADGGGSTANIYNGTGETFYHHLHGNVTLTSPSYDTDGTYLGTNTNIINWTDSQVSSGGTYTGSFIMFHYPRFFHLKRILLHKLYVKEYAILGSADNITFTDIHVGLNHTNGVDANLYLSAHTGKYKYIKIVFMKGHNATLTISKLRTYGDFYIENT